jgi:hypothetical protein
MGPSVEVLHLSLCLLRTDRQSGELWGVNSRDPEWMSKGMSKNPLHDRPAQMALLHSMGTTTP